jgi:AraC-like DNA-binding protein
VITVISILDQAVMHVVDDGAMPFEIMRASYVQQRFAPHWHDTFAIGIVERGAGRIWYRGREERHEPGDVIVIAPGELHTGQSADPLGWSYRTIYPPKSLLAAVAGHRAGGRLPYFERSFCRDMDLWRGFAALHRVLESSLDHGHRVTLVKEFLASLVARHGQNDAPAVGAAAAYQRVDIAREYLERHFAKSVTLDELSEVAGVSSFHLIRIFKKTLGLPPHMYLAQFRIERAKEMLRNGAPIAATAFATGFSDQSHLTRKFKRIVGVTPGQYSMAYAERRATLISEDTEAFSERVAVCA